MKEESKSEGEREQKIVSKRELKLSWEGGLQKGSEGNVTKEVSQLADKHLSGTNNEKQQKTLSQKVKAPEVYV